MAPAPSVLTTLAGGPTCGWHYGVTGGSTQRPVCLLCRDLCERHNTRCSAADPMAQHGLYNCGRGGINDIKSQKMKVPKEYVGLLVDSLLDTRKQVIISGPVPPPRFGDIKLIRVRQFHIWLTYKA